MKFRLNSRILLCKGLPEESRGESSTKGLIIALVGPAQEPSPLLNNVKKSILECIYVH